MDTIDFIKYINKQRKLGGWYGFNGTVNGKDITIKGYGTWLQIFKINGLSVPTGIDLKVKDYNELLNKYL